MRRRNEWAIRILAVLALSVLGVIVGLLLSSADDGQSEEEVTKQVVTEVVDALETNCQINLKYRKQTRERAIINQAAQQLQVKANEGLINILNAVALQPGVSDEVLEAVAKQGAILDHVNARINQLLASSTVLLPLPICGNYAEALDEGGYGTTSG